MLTYFYHGAFDAAATTRNMLFGEHNAMVEGDFVGKHIGEFADIPATGKDVRVPLCVVYDLESDQIKFSENRIGLDHLSLSVASMADLEAAVELFDARGISRGEIKPLEPLTTSSTMTLRMTGDSGRITLKTWTR